MVHKVALIFNVANSDCFLHHDRVFLIVSQMVQHLFDRNARTESELGKLRAFFAELFNIEEVKTLGYGIHAVDNVIKAKRKIRDVFSLKRSDKRGVKFFHDALNFFVAFTLIDLHLWDTSPRLGIPIENG